MQKSLKEIYERRFHGLTEKKKKIWDILCNDFFQRFVGRDAIVLDVGAGYCEFINAIKCGKKIAVDLNPDIKKFANPEVQVIVNHSNNLKKIKSDSVDVVFVSNFFEHLYKEDILKTLSEIHRVLKRGGRFLILQPNLRFWMKDYWSYFDHLTPLDDRSMTEALEIYGFKIVKCIPRFIPSSSKERYRLPLFLLRIYLKLPFLWLFFGQQMFILAEK